MCNGLLLIAYLVLAKLIEFLFLLGVNPVEPSEPIGYFFFELLPGIFLQKVFDTKFGITLLHRLRDLSFVIVLIIEYMLQKHLALVLFHEDRFTLVNQVLYKEEDRHFDLVERSPGTHSFLKALVEHLTIIKHREQQNVSILLFLLY